MWIVMNDSFLSVVKDRKSNRLLVRARTYDDLAKIVPSKRIFIDDDADYRFRTWMTKREFSDIMTDRINGIDYCNFKNSVPNDFRRSLYERVWQVLFNLDRKRKYDWFGWLKDEDDGLTDLDIAGYNPRKAYG